MTQSDRTVLRRLTGAAPERRVTTDDLQGLLLQVTFALLMIFIIAYFIFVDQQKKARAEELLALNRQKLTLAVEKVAEDRRIGYGLNALMTQGVDGKRSFDPDQFVHQGAIRLSGAAKTAFASGAKAAFADYSDPSALTRRWRAEVLAAAGLEETALTDDERVWFGKVLEVTIENVRLDVRGVQRALAARLLRWWIENPKTLPGYAQAASAESLAVFAGQVASLLKSESLERVAAEIGGEVLP